MTRLLLIALAFSLSLGQLIGQFNVTFEVNAQNITVDPGGLFVAGGTGFGIPGDNQLLDPDGDGIYTVTLEREPGFSSNYIFLNGNCPDWSCKEDIAGLPCSDPLNFNDRFLPELSGDVTIQACYGNCADDGTCMMSIDSIAITFELNTELITVDSEGIYVAGGGSFGFPGDNPMIDPDGDGIYTVTIGKPAGFSGFYTFTNGICPDFLCKEAIGGLPCANAANFNDRFLSNVTQDTTITACFGNCDPGGDCSVVTDMVELTIELNTNSIDVDPGGIFVAGGGNFGNPGDNPMIDPEGDGIFTFTTTRPVGFSSFYTFLNGNCPDWSCKEDIAGLPCADPNAFNDRFLPAIMENTIVRACFANCADDGSCSPVSTTSLQVDDSLFKIYPTIASQSVDIKFGQQTSGLDKNVVVTDVSGNRIYNYNTRSEKAHTVNLNGYASGVYVARVQVGLSVLAQKFIVQ